MHDTHVPTTAMVTQLNEHDLVLFDAPVHGSESNGVSNVDVGQERLVIGRIESELIRRRGSNQRVSAQSIGLILTATAPPWPNANAPANLPARHDKTSPKSFYLVRESPLGADNSRHNSFDG